MRYETLYKRPSFAMQETAFYRAICALLECEKRKSQRRMKITAGFLATVGKNAYLRRCNG